MRQQVEQFRGKEIRTIGLITYLEKQLEEFEKPRNMNELEKQQLLNKIFKLVRLFRIKLKLSFECDEIHENTIAVESFRSSLKEVLNL